MPLCASSHYLFQVLGIAARVFGVDISLLSERMDEVTSFMGRHMVDFNNCVSGILDPSLLLQVRPSHTPQVKSSP